MFSESECPLASEQSRGSGEHASAGSVPPSTEELISRNKKLIYTILNRHYPHKAEDEDYIQVATIGLWKAAKGFENGIGRFSTYAYACIRRELSAYDRLENRSKRKKDVPDLSLDDMSMEQLVAGPSFEERLLSRYRAEEILRRIRKNNPRQAYVLTQRMRGRSSAELAHELHLSRQWIHQMCIRSRRWLAEE
ncbi:sigma-70 family RNA polymerase sigma factor [Papillibacter cinnamivorans]|uniref:RNA polymerase sigma factor, sigma-70 family n=1 Tax=Papillibacter cinnamivorans DSM 12816 TaxID=1122930 RepID=A0A1W2D3A4_9FIRM|nr:sigma-70 family RNA polymerase sigma factor [Papillibacter cinnamivorans]SMC91562.1 RNA polymerase sigma factor, sigma-70 family [Papillibacter cinnamivorans DSM 12816]